MEKKVVLTEAERNLRSAADDGSTGKMKPPLYKFVFTGGPCGGKTTSLARVFSFLRERNFEVITCPEAYTILNSNGMSAAFFSTEGMDKVIQGCVMDCQLTFENSVSKVLSARGKPAVMLCDRGLMDGSIFVSTEIFDEVLTERNLNIVQARDNRYDAIFHLVTAADGAEAYYTLENNKVRWESKEQARVNDKLIQKAWVGHPHLYVIDNSTDFEGKMSRLVDIICKIVGLPSNLKRRSVRFLLRSIPDLSTFPSDVIYQVFDVEKVYLQRRWRNTEMNDSSERRGGGGRNSDMMGELSERGLSPAAATNESYSFIRRRTNIDPITGQDLGSVYQLTVATVVEGTGSSSSSNEDELIEQKRIISHREYESTFASGRDMNRYIVKQRRISFLYAKQSFNIHIYQEPAPGLCILHAQVEAEKDDFQENNNDSNNDAKIELPPFLDIERRLTGEDDDKYGAYSLSIIRS